MHGIVLHSIVLLRSLLYCIVNLLLLTYFRSDEGLTLETSAVILITVANLHFQLTVRWI